MENNKLYKSFTPLMDRIDEINANPELKKRQVSGFEFILEDRLAKIRAINEQYDLEHNAYIAFSGGKDSCVVSHLIDLALPNNKIPRVYSNTGIEYSLMTQFVKEQALKDERIIILNQKRNIIKTLKEYGYPFKSKDHSKRVKEFNLYGRNATIKRYLNEMPAPPGKKIFHCPKCLKYQFNEGFKDKLLLSDLCCQKLKKDLAQNWQKENNKNMVITGLRKAEGGSRNHITCLSNGGHKFHPLAIVEDDWENEFVEREKVSLCKLYYPPYNFKRTGCKGCPFNRDIQKDLETLYKYLPNEYKQCLHLWKPVYDEYIRIGYRLKEYPHNIINKKFKKLF